MLSLLRGLFDLIYPPACSACGVSSASPVCSACERSLPLINGPTCGRCGKPTAVPVGRCRECSGWRDGFDLARSAGLYTGGLREIVHSLKYGRRRELAPFLSGLMLRAGSDLPVPDVVTFVPLWRARERERGYNQSRSLALEVGRRLERPVLPLLRKVKDTPPQNSLTMEGRRKNLKGAFAVRMEDSAAGRTVLVVDDVFTTGSTLREAALALRKCGASRVDALTVARTPRD